MNSPPLVLVGGFKHELNSFAQGTFSLQDVARSGYDAEREHRHGSRP